MYNELTEGQKGNNMAYININTYDILEVPEKEELDDYFECDEFIAPIISLLNKKGYKTKFCCEGHLFDGAIASRFTPYDENKEPDENIVSGYVSHETIHNGEFKYLVHIRNAELHGYITFESYVNIESFLDTFPELNVFPYYENQSIRWDYIKASRKSFVEKRQEELKLQADPYKHFEIRINFLKEVYEWVKSLPEYDSIISDEDRLKRNLVNNELQEIKKIMQSKLEEPDIIDSFLNVYLMNYKIMVDGDDDFKRMLSLDFNEKVDFFTKKYNEMVCINESGDYYISFNRK